MLANRMLDLDGLKAMFDQAEAAHRETSEDLAGVYKLSVVFV
jgi:hypothetical protein